MRSFIGFGVLPEIPEIWLGFLRSELNVQPAVCELETFRERSQAVREHAARNADLCRALIRAAVPGSVQTQENIRRLQMPGSVAVVADFQPMLLGGPAFQILKCLTAIRSSHELEQLGVSAVPVCWIHEAAAPSVPMDSVWLPDSESGLHNLQLGRSDGTAVAGNEVIHADQAAALLSQIREIGQGAFDTETFEIIRASYVPGATLSSACAHLVSSLMEEWGMVVLDAAAPGIGQVFNQAAAASRVWMESGPSWRQLQDIGMPVAACVIGPYEIHAYVRALQVFETAGLPKPMPWPQCSATLLDARSRRIFERFRLTLDQLYSGEEEVARRIANSTPRAAFEKLARLRSEVEGQITELRGERAGGSDWAQAVDACGEKVLYQLRKLQDLCSAAETRKEHAIRRQLRIVCSSLAPNGRVQEREIGGIQIPLRFSRGGLRSLCEQLDIRKLEHQLISMD